MLTILANILLTLIVYWFFRRVYLHFKHPLLNIVILSAAFLIALLHVLDLPFSFYEPSKNAMTFLLGPATVGLAVPLYRYRLLLRQNLLPILTSVAVGACLAMLLASVIALIGGLPYDVVMSIIPKGVSIPFAVEVATAHGGVAPLAAAFVVATGTSGSLIGIWLLDFLRIGSPMARGLALGTMAHAQGTATALMEGEEQGAMAGLAMILAGILTAALAPAIIWLLALLPVG